MAQDRKTTDTHGEVASLFFWLSEGQPPHPELELQRIVELCDERGHAWLGVKTTSFPKRARAGGGFVMAMAKAKRGRHGERLVLIARKTSVVATLPEDAPERELYYGHDYQQFVRVEDTVLVRGDVRYSDVPGTFGEERVQFENNFSRPMTWAAPTSTPTLLAEKICAPSARTSEARTSAPTLDSIKPPRPGSEARQPVLSVMAASAATADDSSKVLFGVDWSGGAEKNGKNPKVWVASLDRGQARLEWGGDGFGRTDVARRIQGEAGVWVLDFPFGIPARVAGAIGLDAGDWSSWIRWIEASTPFDPTSIRDRARMHVTAAKGLWSELRKVDEAIGTTWFPLFEQLYRQTITGAHDLLGPVSRADSVAVVPFSVPTDATRTIVCEGFPGFVIREQLGLSATGYKKATPEARERRTDIVNALERALGASLERVRTIAIDDTEGDALDALVLLLAARRTATLTPHDWTVARTELSESGCLIEGWFPGA